MTVAEVAEYLGCSVPAARNAHRRLMAWEDRIMAAWEEDERKRTKRRAEREARRKKSAAVRRRPPEWCLPPWERKNGAQNIVYCRAMRARRDKEPVEAWWVWTDGKPVVKSDTLEGAKALAGMRAMLYDTYVWDAGDWEKTVAADPQMQEVLKAYGR